MAISGLASLLRTPAKPVSNNLLFQDEELNTLFSGLAQSPGQIVILTKGNGFRTRSQVSQDLYKILLRGPSPSKPQEFISVPEIAESLDLQSHEIENLLPQKASDDDWARSGDKILTNYGYLEAAKALIDELERQPVHVHTFCVQRGLTKESFNQMIAQYDELPQDISHRLEISEESGYACLHRVKELLKQSLLEQMKAATEPTILVTNTDRPIPKLTELILELGRSILAQGAGSVRGLIQREMLDVLFTPLSFLQTRRDRLLQDLRDQKIKFITKSDIAQLDIESEGFESFIAKPLGKDGLLLKGACVSMAYFDTLVIDTKDTLREKGAASIPIRPSELTGQDLLALSNAIFASIKKEDNALEGAQQMGRFNEHIVKQSYQDSVKAEVMKLAKAQAAHSEPKSSSVSTARVFWPQIVDSIHKTRQGVSEELISSLLSPDIQSSASDTYASALTSAQQESQNAFTKFWTSKCLTKTQLHLLGLTEIQDLRLRSELRKITLAFLIEKSIPDVLRRADDAGYLHGRAHVRVVDILERRISALEASLSQSLSSANAKEAEDDVQAISEGLEDALAAFSRAMGVAAPEESALEASKKAYLKDMIESANRENDSARLFLKLILTLVARHRKGTIYASGRFAPRLMKDLGSDLDDKEYNWLRQMRDKARTGSMSAEDIEDVRNAIKAASS